MDLQISAGGKTTSLGDHDTEDEAARAFDRAAINKAGELAKTNFSIEDYRDEIADLQGTPSACQQACKGRFWRNGFGRPHRNLDSSWYAAMQQTELVAMLRSRARKSGTQTSHYRGVSLLKQTQKWHAQINVGGRQVT